MSNYVWYHDPRMLAAGDARRRPGGESDLAQPGSAKAMPAAPSGPIVARRELARLHGQAAGREFGATFAEALTAEANRVGISPTDLARLYALAYSRPQHNVQPPRRPGVLARLFSRKSR
jgi:hypothetical protein